MPTYFVNDADCLESPAYIRHFDLHQKEEITSDNWFPDDQPVDIVLTSGASCPDALLDEIVRKIVAWFPEARSIDDALAPFETDE